MPNNRESESLAEGRGDEPTLVVADDVHELQEHEFTLEVEIDLIDVLDSEDPGWTEEHTARWSRQKPLPAWANTARALLEDQPLPAAGELVVIDDNPTRKSELISCTVLELRSLREEAEQSRGDAQASQRALQQAQLELAEAQAALTERDRQLALHTAEQLGRSHGQAFRIAELELQLSEAHAALLAIESSVAQVASSEPAAISGEPEPVSPARKRRRKRDDLQQIRGIGPRFAERLDGLGMSTYARIAAWTPLEVTRIAEQLGISAQRIRREAWVKQALRLRKAPNRARK